MIRLVFDNGEIADCEHINKIYIEEIDEDKITIVGCLKNPCETCVFSDCPVDHDECVECQDKSYKEEMCNERLSDLGGGKTGEEIQVEV